MPPKRRGMRRFFCCGPKDEAESDLPVKPAKQVSEKVDRSGVTSSGKAKKENQNGESKAVKASGEADAQDLSTEKPEIPTSEEEATKDHLTAEKPVAPTTESEGIKEDKQPAETPAPLSGDIAKEQSPVDAPAVATTAVSGKEESAAGNAPIETTGKPAEEKLPAEDPLSPSEEKLEAKDVPAEKLTVMTTAEATKDDSAADKHDASTDIAEDSWDSQDHTAPAIGESTEEVPVTPSVDEAPEIFFTPAEERPQREVPSTEPPAIPAKAEARGKAPPSPTTEKATAEASVTTAKEDSVVADVPISANEEPVADHPSTEDHSISTEREEPAEIPASQATTAQEESPADTSSAITEQMSPAVGSTVVPEEEEKPIFTTKETSESHITQTEDETPVEDSVVPSREVVPVDPPIVLAKDEDTHSEGHSATATDLDDDASSHTTDAPEPAKTREDSVIPKGSDQKITIPRLFPNNKQGDALQRVIEAYIVNGKSDWKLVRKYLPKPKANGDDSAAKLTKVVLTRMLENCLSEVELTEGRVFLPILREQLAQFYWEDHKDKEAIKLWRKVLGDSANGDSDSIVYRARTNATRSLCNIYFTKALEAHISGEDPSKYAKRLEEAAGRGADPVSTMWWYAHCSSLMLTAWHQMYDDTDRALENFRFNAKCAVGKLEGRNPSNAESGFLLLAETLMTAADNWGGHVEGDENATRAMSLFLQSHYGVSAETSDHSSAKAQTYGACETCETELSWGHFQTCRFCKVDLCDSCHKDLEETTLKVRVCSPIHEFFRTSGPAPHEIPKDHVLLDGEHVHYKQWIQMLKEEWGL